MVVSVGPQASPGPMEALGWPGDANGSQPPGFVDSLIRPVDGGAGAEGFLRAVAAAYEAGATISFAGLFLGERRRRIAIPGYPFQRRRFWVQPAGSTA